MNLSNSTDLKVNNKYNPIHWLKPRSGMVAESDMFDHFYKHYHPKVAYRKKSYRNAFWNPLCNCLVFGDGGGKIDLPYVALEIVAHEITHGVTGCTAKLLYAWESGGLNKATSDNISVLVDSDSFDRGYYNPN